MRPSTSSAVYSGGPNPSAKLASGGATTVSTTTSVPTTQPRNAYHKTSGRNATEKPRMRLSMVASTGRLESERAVRERRLEQRPEQEIGEKGHADAEGRRRKDRSSLDRD